MYYGKNNLLCPIQPHWLCICLDTFVMILEVAQFKLFYKRNWIMGYLWGYKYENKGFFFWGGALSIKSILLLGL